MAGFGLYCAYYSTFSVKINGLGDEATPFGPFRAYQAGLGLSQSMVPPQNGTKT
jgi:hypothetical protein